MKCLAVNTANTLLSISIVEGDLEAYAYSSAETRDQGNLLLAHVQKGLAEAGLSFDDLDLLAVVTGPGSFTGIRIGLAAMRGISLASDKPLVGISSFELFGVAGAGLKNITAIESFREELYLQAEGHAPVNQKPEDFAFTLGGEGNGYLISGDARKKLQHFLPAAFLADAEPTAKDAAFLAMEKFRKNGASERPGPFYLREADVSFSAKENRKVDI
jgi:tRNA threonylcarbamoyladenosine biosynthesis protein TsaB